MSSAMSRPNRAAVISAAVALAAGVGVTAAVTSPADAIPASSRACALTLLSNTAASGWQPVTSSVVTINNGTAARYVVVNFNADAGVDTAAEIRLGYRVDGGSVVTPGAQNFASHTEYWQTRHNMVVMYVPAGTHTIQPYWRISGATGKNGVIHSRCLTAEAYTS